LILVKRKNAFEGWMLRKDSTGNYLLSFKLGFGGIFVIWTTHFSPILHKIIRAFVCSEKIAKADLEDLVRCALLHGEKRLLWHKGIAVCTNGVDHWCFAEMGEYKPMVELAKPRGEIIVVKGTYSCEYCYIQVKKHCSGGLAHV